MRLLLDGFAAVRKLSAAGRGGFHFPLAPASPIRLRGLAAGHWRASDERGGRAPTFESLSS
jgi:hypothetical protein